MSQHERTARATALRERFALARASGLRAKEAAESLGVSEGAAVEAHSLVHGPGVHPGGFMAMALRGPWIDLLKALKACGPLMALTRNESVVHEKTGVYDKLSAQGQVGLALGADIDLRLFFEHWHAGYAVTDAGKDVAGSLQFFDRHGTAVHKIFLREATDLAAWRTVIEAHAEPAQAHDFETKAGRGALAGSVVVDVTAFSQAWGAMTDTHQFFPLLRQFGVERQQALRLVQGQYTHRVERSAVAETLHEAAFDGTPVMAFVGSPGCIQIHTGPVKRVESMDVHGKRWLNVLDPGFNLHLREDCIGNCWVVEKPTSDGAVTSLEVFDQDGGLMAMFFGARKPGQPELQAWRDILSHLLVVEPVVCA
jgi:putative hemin transport protein